MRPHKAPAAPDVSSEAPLDTFSRCHLGIIAQLCAAAELPDLADAAMRARRVAGQTLRMFKDVVIAHHAEEEAELFPAVLRSATPEEQPVVRRMVDQLTAQHRTIEAQWKQIEAQVRHVARGDDAELDHDRMAEVVQLYLQHARTEEAEFLPMADRILRRNGDHLAALAMSLHMRHAPPVMSYI